MHRIRITHIHPLHDRVLLVAFEDRQLCKHDVKLVVNPLGALSPNDSPDQIRTKLLANQELLSSLTVEIDHAEEIAEGDSVAVTIPVDVDLLARLEKYCQNLDISVEQLLLAALRFRVDPRTKDIACEWLSRSFSESCF